MPRTAKPAKRIPERLVYEAMRSHGYMIHYPPARDRYTMIFSRKKNGRVKQKLSLGVRVILTLPENGYLGRVIAKVYKQLEAQQRKQEISAAKRKQDKLDKRVAKAAAS